MDPNSGPALPPELMALLQSGGGGGAPTGAPTGGPGGGAGLPPQLAAALQGGGAPSDPSQGAGPSDSEGGSDLPSDPIALIQSMIDAAKKYIDVEPDEEDKLTMTGVLQKLQQYLAKDQKDGEQMMSGTLTPRA